MNARSKPAPPDDLSIPCERDLERQIADLAARTEISGAANRRSSTLQRLLSKIIVLSDREFDSAVVTLEGLVDGFHQRKAGRESGDAKAKPTDIVRDVEKALKGASGLTQNQGK